MERNYLDLLDEVRAVAKNGLHYSKDPFDRERYTKLLKLASQHYSSCCSMSTKEIETRFCAELGQITPKLGVQGALFDEEGRLLLEKRKDDLSWGLLGGWVEANESPEDSLRREFLEESALHIEPRSPIGFYTRSAGAFCQPHGSVHILYYCQLVSGTIEISHESLELTFMNPLTIETWHKDHRQQALDALKFQTNSARGTKFTGNFL